jgi:hypothetical protein
MHARWKRQVTAAVLAVGFSAAAATILHAHADAPADKPGAADPAGMYVEVYLPSDRKPIKVSGKLVSHDDAGVVIDTPSDGQRTLGWDEMTPTSAFTLKARLIDKASASDWFELGKWAWDRKLDKQARTAFVSARKLDTSLGPKIDEVLKSTPAGPAQKPTPPSEAAGPATKPANDGATAKPDAADGQAGVTQPGYKRGAKIVPYAPATPEQHAAALEAAKKRAAEVADLLKVKFATVESDHFIIFTDWDPAEHQFIKDNCEQAYALVARQFQQKPKDNIFIGKLPMYMFERQRTFQDFASEADNFGAGGSVLGYFAGNNEGIGHMAMWKPRRAVVGATDAARRDAERRWGRTLIHEFVHAFINRYRSNGSIPRWLNEGIAEYISEGELPTPGYFANAREIAWAPNEDISHLWDDNQMPSGRYYPVMMSLVKLLAEEKPKSFISYFNDIKDGMDPEDALRKHYGVSYAQFEETWRLYARKLK